MDTEVDYKSYGTKVPNEFDERGYTTAELEAFDWTGAGLCEDSKDFGKEWCAENLGDDWQTNFPFLRGNVIGRGTRTGDWEVEIAGDKTTRKLKFVYSHLAKDSKHRPLRKESTVSAPLTTSAVASSASGSGSSQPEKASRGKRKAYTPPPEGQVHSESESEEELISSDEDWPAVDTNVLVGTRLIRPQAKFLPNEADEDEAPGLKTKFVLGKIPKRSRDAFKDPKLIEDWQLKYGEMHAAEVWHDVVKDVIAVILRCTDLRLLECGEVGTSEKELLKFYSLKMGMSLLKLPSELLFWSGKRVGALQYPNFSVYMEYRRYCTIKRHLCFTDKEEPPVDVTGKVTSITWKVDECVEALQATLARIHPQVYGKVVVDEGMIKAMMRMIPRGLGRGMPNKPIRRGIKLWILGDCKTGCPVGFYIDKGDLNSKNCKELAWGVYGEVVLRFARELTQQDVIFFVDRLFPSPALARKLLIMGHGMTAMWNHNRGASLEDSMIIPSKKPTIKNPKGTVVAFHCEDKLLQAWSVMDTGRYFMLDTENGGETTEISRRQKGSSDLFLYDGPLANKNYQMDMGAVDAIDQQRANKSGFGAITMQGRARKWTHRMVDGLFDIASVFSHAVVERISELYLPPRKKMTYSEHVGMVHEGLLNPCFLSRASAAAATRHAAAAEADRLALDPMHPCGNVGTAKGPKRTCAYCRRDSKKYLTVRRVCQQCDPIVYLHPGACHHKYHIKVTSGEWQPEKAITPRSSPEAKRTRTGH